MNLRKIKCYFGYHNYEMTDWIMPYKKECKICNKKMRFIGWNIWTEDK